jgi:hypothetical protein
MASPLEPQQRLPYQSSPRSIGQQCPSLVSHDVILFLASRRRQYTSNWLFCGRITYIAYSTLSPVSQEFVAAAAPDASTYHISGTLLHAVYKWTSLFGSLFLLGINTLMYSSLLYKSKLVPRPLAALGLAGATLELGYAMLVMFSVAVQGSDLFMLLALPIAVYEMILAVWLIVKGFNPAAIAPRLQK